MHASITHPNYTVKNCDPYNGVRVGEARKPGPSNVNPGPYLLEVANVTHLSNNAHTLCTRSFNAMIVTEHSLVPSQFNKAAKIFTKRCKLDLSGLDQEHANQVGGTGMILAGNNHIIKPKPLNKNLIKLNGKGRCGMYGIEPCKNTIILVYGVYGVTRGDSSDQAAASTCDIISSILQDADEQEVGPKLIVGDFNASIHRLPSLEQAIREGKYTDVGSIASNFKGVDNDTTCKASEKCKATRRDYVIANTEALSLIDTFKIDHDAHVPVHDIIQVQFKGQVALQKYDAVKLPKTIHSIFLEQCRENYGNINIAKADTLIKEKLNKRITSFKCEVALEGKDEDTLECISLT